MFKKIAVGAAIAVLSLGIAAPAAAATAAPKATDGQVVAMGPGFFCMWFGWC